jgi:DMSO/TMAO reductase YedYZ molybdopterin-dependent catalytic subunit
VTGLPPGQRALDTAPIRFGLDQFLRRRVEVPASSSLVVGGAVEVPITLGLAELFSERRVDAAHDMHCVTTWTALGLRWSGRRFADVWEHIVVPRARPAPGAKHLLCEALDGYQAAVPLEEALAPEALLADRLDGAPLTLNHGAPLRLVVPQLYGYKSVKHLVRLTLHEQPPAVPVSRFLAHHRGRVDLEERSGVGGQRFWRLLYQGLRPLFLRGARRYQLDR